MFKTNCTIIYNNIFLRWVFIDIIQDLGHKKKMNLNVEKVLDHFILRFLATMY